MFLGGCWLCSPPIRASVLLERTLVRVVFSSLVCGLLPGNGLTTFSVDCPILSPCQLFSPIYRAHRRASTYRSSLFMPSTNPLTQGEYAGVICCLMPHFMQFSLTSLLLKCHPPSLMKVSGGAYVLQMLLSNLFVVFALPAILNMSPQTCCENVSRYKPTVW